jgi:hypothetical protein
MPQPAKPRKPRTTTKKTPPAKTKITPPDIAAMSARIAKDNTRVTRFMESLVNHVDLIVDAATAEDWQEVARQAEYLAGGGATHGCSELSHRAAELSETLKNPYNVVTARRQIVRLIGACGRVRKSESVR